MLGAGCVSTERAPKPAILDPEAPGWAAWDGERGTPADHNDCFLASAGDTGRYPQENPEPMKDYVADEGRFVPVGGETCGADKPRSDCPTAVAELARLHWSYLNAQFSRDGLDGWQTQGCLSEVRRDLGYRFRLA